MDPNALCQALVDATSKTLVWEWDDRFGCAVAAFEASHADAVRTAVCQAAGEEWSPANIASAPARVQQAAASVGLRSGQFMFTSDASAGMMVYVAWWPWGNGLKISVRFFVDGASEDQLQAWFGLS